MAEVTNELIHELLNSIQPRMSNLEEGQREMKAELRAIRGHMHAIQLDTENLYQSVTMLEIRVERIERRLDLVASPA